MKNLIFFKIPRFARNDNFFNGYNKARQHVSTLFVSDVMPRQLILPKDLSFRAQSARNLIQKLIFQKKCKSYQKKLYFCSPFRKRK